MRPSDSIVRLVRAVSESVFVRRRCNAAMQTHELMRFRAGNEKIFAALFLSLEPRLRRQIRTYMPGDRDAADDLFQGVCMKIFSHRNAYRGSGPLAAWCARLCARFCIDHLRAEARA